MWVAVQAPERPIESLGDDMIVTAVVATVAERYPEVYVASLSPMSTASVSGPGWDSGPIEQLLDDVLLEVADEVLGEHRWTAYGETRDEAVAEVARRAGDHMRAEATSRFVLAFVLARRDQVAVPPRRVPRSRTPLARSVPLSGAGSTHAPPAALPHLIPVEARAA